MPARRRARQLAVAVLAAALGGASASFAAGSDTLDTLVKLANEALASGEVAEAEGRYERVLAARPGSVAALVGLARVAALRGDRDAARGLFERALAADPASVQARVGLADIETAEGNPTGAREILERALSEEGALLGVHLRLERLTGRAGGASPASLEEAQRLAEAHPYDPAALVGAGSRLVDAGRGEEALPLLRKAVWLADLDPAAAGEALALLPGLDPAWQGRRVVPVHVYADESVRAEASWRFRLRSLWGAASVSLDPLLSTRFVVVSMRGFSTSDLSSALEPMFERLIEASGETPKGIVAGFTARPPPRARGLVKRGLARFLGRHLIARAPRPVLQSRVLSHEILHLYGAVHVGEYLDSLMNPTGGAMRLDEPNSRIVRAVRDRSFGTGIYRRDVLAKIDLEETIAAYEESLSFNLYLREAGLGEALAKSRESRFVGRRYAKLAKQLDPHLADVSRMLAGMLLAVERRVEALVLLERAAWLYGNTEKGRETAAAARDLRRALEKLYAPEP